MIQCMVPKHHAGLCFSGIWVIEIYENTQSATTEISWLVTLQVPNHVWIRYRKKGIPREMTEKESKQTNQDWAIIGPIKRK